MPKTADNNTRQTILPGLKPVLELLSENPQRIARIYCSRNFRGHAMLAAKCQKNGVPIELVDSGALDSICADGGHAIAHQGVVATLSRARLASLGEVFAQAETAPLPLILALDQVQDPGNLGTLCRTAWALGVSGIILPRHNSACLGAAAYKASGGTLDKMPIAIVANLARALDSADELGLAIYGAGHAEEDGRHALDAFTMRWQLPAILVLGNENRGIRPGVAKRCSIFVNIPFARKFDSLNIAQAGAILLGLCAAQSIS